MRLVKAVKPFPQTKFYSLSSADEGYKAKVDAKTDKEYVLNRHHGLRCASINTRYILLLIINSLHRS